MTGQPCRLASRRPHRSRRTAFTVSTAARSAPIPATRWPRRCSPTASAWSGAASSTTGPAACSRPASRSRTRWCSCARAGGASRTAAPPPSRLSRAGGGEPGRLAVGRISTIGAPLGAFARFMPAGFYYKTFIGPGRGTLGMFCERFIRRAAGSGDARPSGRSRQLREGQRLLRRAGGRRRRRPGWRRRWPPAGRARG